jgi:hypothetical protein
MATALLHQGQGLVLILLLLLQLQLQLQLLHCLHPLNVSSLISAVHRPRFQALVVPVPPPVVAEPQSQIGQRCLVAQQPLPFTSLLLIPVRSPADKSGTFSRSLSLMKSPPHQLPLLLILLLLVLVGCVGRA